MTCMVHCILIWEDKIDPDQSWDPFTTHTKHLLCYAIYGGLNIFLGLFRTLIDNILVWVIEHLF